MWIEEKLLSFFIWVSLSIPLPKALVEWGFTGRKQIEHNRKGDISNHCLEYPLITIYYPFFLLVKQYYEPLNVLS